MTDKKQPQQQLEEVVLLKPHTHKGRQRAVGDKIDVNARQKSWLISLGKVATDEPAAPAVKPAPAKANKE